MKRCAYSSLTAVVVMMILLVWGTADALTVTASPATTTPRQVVNFSVGTVFGANPPLGTCGLVADFGDGQIQNGIPLTNCSTPATFVSWTCSNTVSHAYTTPGFYTATIGVAGCGALGGRLNFPDIQTRITVNCPTQAGLSSTALPAATVGIPYSYQLPISGGNPPYSVTLLGTLPSGLAMSPTGLISGTPAAGAAVSSPWAFSVMISDSCPVYVTPSAISLSLTINPCLPPTIVTPSPLPAGVPTFPYSQSLVATGGLPPYSWSVVRGLLPSWLALSPAGLLTGVAPNVEQTSDVVLSAASACGAGVLGSFRLQTLCPVLSISTPSLPSGTQGQQYSAQLIGKGLPSKLFTLNTVAGGAPPPGISLSPGGLLSGAPGASGNYTFTVLVSDGCGGASRSAARQYALQVSCPPVSVTSPPTMSAGFEGRPYTFQFSASGGQPPYGYSLASGMLPPGVSLDPSGALTGIPRSPGIYTFDIRITDSCAVQQQSSVGTFTLTVAAAPPPPPVSCKPQLLMTSQSVLPVGTVGSSYSAQVTASGGVPPVSYALSGSLPPGLSLDPVSGVISGVPAAAGFYSFAVRASDSCIEKSGPQNVQGAFTITVQPAAPVCKPLSIVAPPSLPGGVVNGAYSAQLASSGGQSPVTFSLVGGALPPGLILGPAGNISGTPSVKGNYLFTVAAKDNCPTGSQTSQRDFALLVQPIEANITASPSSFAIARGEAGMVNVTYQLSGTPSFSGVVTSPVGIFTAGGDTIDRVPVPLYVTVQGGTGVVLETISIPVRVVEAALQKGQTQLFFTRNFAGAGAELTARVSMAVTTEAGADFDIRDIKLYFENRRPEITVPLHQPNLRAYIDLAFVGSGLLKGYWETDEGILSYVNEHLLYGKSVTLQTDIRPLPTFNPGTHWVRFVITSPRKFDSVPTAIYFVEADRRMDEVVLVSPGANEAVPYSPVAFSWEKKGPAAAYLIECLENRNERVVFSAYAKESAYVLPEAVLQAAFAAGETYRWRVKALDGEGRIIAESGLRMLRLVEPDIFVSGQVLAVLGEGDFSEALLKELEGKYGLSILDVFPLKSIGVMTILFKTGGKDVLNTAQELSRDRRFMSVQPNYISSTFADSLAGVNYASGLMQVEKLHVSLKGRGIRVAVIDTGVDTDHPNLAGRVTLSKNFVRGEFSAPEIHGTAVAGIIAAQGGSGIRGIAPEAEILGLRACRQIARERPQGECFSDSLARALDEAILQKAQVVNMSFGSPANDPLALRLLEKGAEQGILFVASAGNNPNDRDLRFPASLPVVVSVSGFDEKLRPYPNEEIGKKTSVSAPAVNIITTVPGNRHNFLTGTSFSSAYVSGLLALALEKDRALTRQRIPVSRGNLCVWEEELLKIALCGK